MRYKNNFKFSIALLVVFAMFFSILPVDAFAGGDASEKTPQEIAQEAAQGAVEYYKEQDKLSEWEQLGALKGVGESLQNEKWIDKLPKWEKKELEETAYASHILGMLAQGVDPRTNWEGKDIVKELKEKQDSNTGSFGNLNTQVWSIIALDAAKESYNVEGALESLLSKQKIDGGFNFWALDGGDPGDPGSTGMALIALSNHKDNENVKKAIKESVKFLHEKQLDNAGFGYGTSDPNTVASVISGLIAVKEDIFNEKWQKNNKTMLDALLEFQLDDKSFFHPYPPVNDGEQPETNDMATRQALIALGDIINNDSVWNRLDIKSVHLRVEGSLNNILDQNITVLPDEEALKIKNIIAKSPIKEQIEYNNSGEMGAEITKINDEENGKFNGEGRWFYLVNDSLPVSGINEEINDGDEILIYYGVQDTLLPIIETSPSKPKIGDDFKIAVKFKEDKPVNITGATVTFNNKDYLTDDNGIAIINHEDIKKPGRYSFKVSKQGSYPQIVRTGKLFVSYLSKDNNDGSNGGITEPTSEQVSLYVKGYKNEILSTKKLTLKKDDTPLSILERALSGRIEYGGSGTSQYVSGIDRLREFDRGTQSGWMYSVNGKFPNVGADSYYLKDGDDVRWLYTLDGGKDIGDTNTGNSGGSISDQEKTPDIPKAEIIKPSAQVQQMLTDKVKSTTAKLLSQDSISDWSLFALARDNEKIPAKHVQAVKDSLKENKGEFRKTTDLEKTILLANSLGLDPLNVEGVNLIEKVYNHKNLENQGVNGLIFGLIALDSGNYEIPQTARWTRDKLSKSILTYQHPDGSFSLAKDGDSDVDITAMAVQALANYKNEENTKAAINRAVNYLATNTKSENCENIAQTIIALTSLGITPEDSKFIKDDKTLLTRLLSYAKEDGSFSHLKGGAGDEIATEQALTALVAYKRYLNGQGSIYTLTDEKTPTKPETEKSYSDIAEVSDWALRSVLKAKEYNLMSGTDLVKNTFEGKRSITRAEFVSLLLRLLDEKPGQAIEKSDQTTSEQVYKDVKPGDWHFRAIMTARDNGLVVGTSPDEFAPGKEITRQEMAAILVRSLKLEASPHSEELNKIKDADKISDWAKNAVHTAYQQKIIVGDNGYFMPTDSVTREMAAAISVRLYEMN